MPELSPIEHREMCFALEIDEQALHNRWEWTGAEQRASSSLARWNP